VQRGTIGTQHRQFARDRRREALPDDVAAADYEQLRHGVLALAWTPPEPGQIVGDPRETPCEFKGPDGSGQFDQPRGRRVEQ
jgi:hypothetical protein